ncbi:MipA/OmpV family protein [Moraxella nasicaprae]|uniref:MipA/OmpV family protein n=1 Tax=Moraxella nasicaprae TaxID=2904122 RepID=A0ABY6F479_9GAMM|nr:MipA/OmpV family protein [Moraxella nasicaprae]UXZ04887.1 MipA/OmpV family protein [Moraxella nasicaprae]
MIAKRPTFAIALLPLVGVNAPSTQLSIDDTARLRVGMNATYHSSSYAADDGVEVMPQAFFDNNRWYIEGAEAGYYPFKSDQHHLRTGISYDGRSFDHDDAKTDALRQLDDRQWSANAYASYMYVSPYGGFKAKVGTDITGRHHGQSVSLSHLSKFNKEKLTIYPEFGAIWYSKKYNDYYYGISSAESVRSGLNTYQAGSGVSPFATVTASYQLNDQISIFGNQRLEWLSSAQKNSPMTDGSLDSKTRLGINYQF